LACYAAKLQKHEATIDWQQPAEVILRQINAFNPWPVAQSVWQDKIVRLWQAETLTQHNNATPGSIIAVSKSGIDVATADGILRITQLQLPGKRAMPVHEFFHAGHLQVGDHFG